MGGTGDWCTVVITECKGCQKPLPKALTRHKIRYCTPECKASSPLVKKRAKRVQTVCPCGESFNKYGGRGRTYCSEFCAKRFDRRGETFKNDPELAREHASRSKPNHGLKGYKQTEEHLIKRLGNGSIRASKEELSLVPVLTKLGYRHTGEGAFWRRWADGTMHNPDFVCEATRTVVEYFGAYWHADDRGREQEIIDAWAEIGWNCAIIWPEDREVLLAQATGGAW